MPGVLFSLLQSSLCIFKQSTNQPTKGGSEFANFVSTTHLKKEFVYTLLYKSWSPSQIVTQNIPETSMFNDFTACFSSTCREVPWYDRSIDRLIDWLIEGRIQEWSMGRLIDWRTDISMIERSIDWLAGIERNAENISFRKIRVQPTCPPSSG